MEMWREMKEIWKPVIGYEEWAEISNYGQVHYYAGKSKKYTDEHWTYGTETPDGYLRATIGGVNKGVHIWVYLTFVGNIPEGMQCNHINEDKHCNRLDNLNLMTPSQNINWGTRNTKVAAALTNHPKKSKPIQALDKITGEVVFTFPSTAEAQRQGFSSGHISECCTGKLKSHKGFIWQYA